MDAVQSNARTAIGLVGNQNEIVWSGAHVEECFQLALGQETTTRNVSYAIFSDALRVQDDV